MELGVVVTCLAHQILYPQACPGGAGSRRGVYWLCNRRTSNQLYTVLSQRSYIYPRTCPIGCLHPVVGPTISTQRFAREICETASKCLQGQCNQSLMRLGRAAH